MGLIHFAMTLGSTQSVEPEPPPEPEVGPAVESAYKSVSNKYVDLTFDMGIYVDDGRVDPVTASNFSIVDFVPGGVTNIAIAAVKRNDHYTSGSATNLLGGENVVRVFLTLTGTPDSTESFRIQCTDIYSPEGGAASPVSATIKLNVTTLIFWDMMETAAVTTLGLGVSQLTDVMGVANFTQSTDAQRPVDGADRIGFNSITPNPSKWMTAGDVNSLEFQKGNSFTIVIKRLSILSVPTSGFIISSRKNSSSSAGWAIFMQTDGSIFFQLHDGTLQGVCDYDGFSGTGEHTLFFVNNNGTMNIRDEEGNILGTTGDATGIGVISYTGNEIYIGRRIFSATTHMHGYFEKIAVINQALTVDQIVDFNDNL